MSNLHSPGPLSAVSAALRTSLRAATVGLLIWPVSLYAFAIRARLVLGHWPAYGQPDPKQLGFASQRGEVYLSFVIFLLLLGAWPILALVGRLVAKRRVSKSAIWCYFLFALLGLGVFIIDPCGIVNWFLD